MNTFEYGDGEIGPKEVFFAVSSMIIGFGVLTLPRTLAETTQSSDGWMSIVLGGLISLGFGWIVSGLSARFPQRGLFEMASAIAGNGIAKAVTMLFALYTLLLVSFESRGVANISKLYLFDRTPEETICLVFLLVVVYGAAGTSISLLRLNLLFLPLVLGYAVFVLVMNASFSDMNNLKPFFITDWRSIASSLKETTAPFLGIEIVLIYNAAINRPAKIAKAMVVGILVPFILYLLVFLFSIAIFGAVVTQNTLYPTAELAKQVEIPGGFFERFESIFFTIWVMNLFTTAAMAFDVTIVALRSLFARVNRVQWAIWLSPLIYLIAMQPRNVDEVERLGTWIGFVGLVIGWGIPGCLLAVATMRGVRGK